jgi:hypothetical protein
MRKLLPKSCFYLLTGTIFYVKLDKAENISFSQLSLCYLLYEDVLPNVYENRFSSTDKVAFRAKANKN